MFIITYFTKKVKLSTPFSQIADNICQKSNFSNKNTQFQRSVLLWINPTLPNIAIISQAPDPIGFIVVKLLNAKRVKKRG